MSVPFGLKKSAAMVVLKHLDLFLLMKRRNPPHVGKFLPVGGKLDPHEDPYSAAIRETKEETGIKLEELTFCGILIESSPLAYNWQSSIYVAEIELVDPPPCDEGELTWISFKDIPDIPTPETDWHVYHYIMNEQPFVFNAIYNASLNLLRMKEEIENQMVYDGGRVGE